MVHVQTGHHNNIPLWYSFDDAPKLTARTSPDSGSYDGKHLKPLHNSAPSVHVDIMEELHYQRPAHPENRRTS